MTAVCARAGAPRAGLRYCTQRTLPSDHALDHGVLMPTGPIKTGCWDAIAGAERRSGLDCDAAPSSCGGERVVECRQGCLLVSSDVQDAAVGQFEPAGCA